MSDITLVGVYLTPNGALRYVTSKDSSDRKKKATVWTTGHKINKNLNSKRRNRLRCKGKCSICLDDSGEVVKCVSGKCKVIACVDCIVKYCKTNEVCQCYDCKYEYTCVDIYNILGDRRGELLDIKWTIFTKLFDGYIDATKKKIDISFEIQDEWNLSEEMGDALVFGLDPPEGTDPEWWSDIKKIWSERSSYNTILKTNYVDLCSKCSGGIHPDTWKCVRCHFSMCRKCGICYNTDHKCSDADVKSRVELLENSKCCPQCTVRIHKSEGCDVMWCTVCKVRFRWDTLDIIEKNMHNPEQSAFVSRFYDGINLRTPGDFNINNLLEMYLLSFTTSRSKAKYRLDSSVEHSVVENSKRVIINAINKMIVLHTHAASGTDNISFTSFETERTNLVTEQWTEDKYKAEMCENARGVFLLRYYAHYLEVIISDLTKLLSEYCNNKNYSNELLYEQYCLKISGYNKDFCYIQNLIYPNRSDTDALYQILYLDEGDYKSYYSVDTGIIIPYMYSTDIDYVIDKARGDIKSILQST